MLLSFEKQSKIPNENSSSSVVANNSDLLRQILLCLPVKSLLVCKSVAKQWLCIISDPSFIHSHYLRYRLSPIGLLLNDNLSFVDPPEYQLVFLDRNITGRVPLKTLTFVDGTSGVFIQQSCNGLLCCSRSANGVCGEIYSIFNPSTKHYRILPTSQFRVNDFLCNVSLAFDPLKSPYYEVVGIFMVKEQKNFRIEIYSSKTDSWRLSADAIHAPSHPFYKPGVFWNGSLHWIDMEMVAIYFDISEELLKKMPVPETAYDEYGATWEIDYFGECRGHLHLIITYGPRKTCFDILEMDTDYTGWNKKYRVSLDVPRFTCFDIFEMVTDYTEWNKIHRVSLEGVVSAYPEIVRGSFKYSVLLVEEEEDGSSKLVLEILNNKVIISCDLKELSFKEIHNLTQILDDEDSEPDTCYAYQYIETLACV